MGINEIEAILDNGILRFEQTKDYETNPAIMYLFYEIWDSRIIAYDEIRKRYEDGSLTLVFYFEKLTISFVDSKTAETLNIIVQPHIASLREFWSAVPTDGKFYFMLSDGKEVYPSIYSPIRINGFSVIS